MNALLVYVGRRIRQLLSATDAVIMNFLKRAAHSNSIRPLGGLSMKLALAITMSTALVITGLLAFSIADDRSQDDEAQIEQMIKAGIANFNSGDFEAGTKDIHPTQFTTFGASPQGELAQLPRDTLLELMEAFTPQLGQVHVSQPIDLKVRVHGDAAFSTYLRKQQLGEKRWSTIRTTGIYFRIDGVWQHVHEHQSVLM